MRTCDLSGKRRNIGNNVSHANNKSKKVQNPNLQRKRIFVPEHGRHIRLTLSTRAIRSINRMGLAAYCKVVGVDYSELVNRHLNA